LRAKFLLVLAIAKEQNKPFSLPVITDGQSGSSRRVNMLYTILQCRTRRGGGSLVFFFLNIEVYIFGAELLSFKLFRLCFYFITEVPPHITMTDMIVVVEVLSILVMAKESKKGEVR
jgi:hypothetical protein